MLESGVLALDRTADSFSLICSASASGSVLFLIPVFMAVMRSTTDTSSGFTEKFRPVANAATRLLQFV